MRRVTLTLVIDVDDEVTLINEAAHRMDHAYGSGEGMGRFVKASIGQMIYESLIACNRDDRSPDEMGLKIVRHSLTEEEVE